MSDEQRFLLTLGLTLGYIGGALQVAIFWWLS